MAQIRVSYDGTLEDRDRVIADHEGMVLVADELHQDGCWLVFDDAPPESVPSLADEVQQLKTTVEDLRTRLEAVEARTTEPL